MLSPVDEDRGQTHVSWSMVGAYCVHPSWLETVQQFKNIHCCLKAVKASYQMGNSVGFSHYGDILMPFNVM